MTAPLDREQAAEPADPRYAPVASAVVVVAAFLVGAGALAVSSVLSAVLVRLLIALVLIGAGWAIARPAQDPDHALTLAVGSHVLRGVGTSYGVLGAYLGGLALLTVSIPDGPFERGPSATVVILLGHGIPALALLAVATTGMRAWTAGAGAVLPMIAVLLMAGAGAGTAAVSITMFAVGVVLAIVVVRAPGGAAWGNLASAAAAMATSFAYGAGTSPFGTLGATQLAGAPETSPAGTLSGGALVAVLAGSLLVAAILLLVAVARHDLAAGVLTGSIFAMPPVLLSTWLPPDARWPAEAVVALAGVPVVVALTAMLAIRVPRVRDTLTAALPPPPDPVFRTTTPDGDPQAPGAEHRESGTASGVGPEPPIAAPGGEPQESGPTTDPWGPAAARRDEPPESAATPGVRPGTPVAARGGTPRDSATAPVAGPGAGPGDDGRDSATSATAGPGAEPGGASHDPAAASSDPATTAPSGDSADTRPDATGTTPAHTRPTDAATEHPVADRRRPSSAIATAACAVIVAAAVVAFVVLAVPVFGWDARVQGGVALVVLAGVAALGYWLPATPGAAGAIVALLGLALASPWARLLGNWASASDAERVITGALDLVAAAALAWFLIRRHPRAGVFAAATYTLAGSAAAFLGSLLFDADYYINTGTLPFGGEAGPVVIVALPLLLLGLAAAAALVRGHLAVGQAVGAVVLAAAGFVPLKVLVGEFTGGGIDGYALQFALNPLTPTDWLQTSAAFREVTGPALVAMLVMVLLALGLAASLAVRPSAPLAGAVALLLLAAVQASLLTVLSSGSPEDAQVLGQVLGGLAVLTAVIAAATAARRT